MVKNTTTFRFDDPFLDFLERMAAGYEITKTDVVRQSVLIVGAMFAEAGASSLADLAALRERFGDDAELACTVEVASNGTPLGIALINGEPADGVRVVPYVDRDGGRAHMYLEVKRERAQGPNHIPFGDQWLLVEPQTSIGKLPWPPRKDRVIKMRLGDLATLLPEPVEAVAV